jgi:hypothetical protein
MKKMHRWGSRLVWGLDGLIISLVLVACGGGGGYGGGGASVPPPATSSSAVATGTMTKGSVIVNGVHFTAGAGAAIRIDDNPGRPETELHNGMKVKVKGTINGTGTTGEFQQVEAEPEVRGLMSAKGVDDFLVNGQHVYVDDRTVFEDRVAGTFSSITLADLSNANEVEIHGGRDDLGRIRASRVERRDDGPVDEVKGTIASAPNGATFQLASAGSGTITVNYGLATAITPTGATLNLGNPVEVHGSFSGGIITATIIDREDLEDAGYQPAEGQEMRAEGFVSGFIAHPGLFQVGGRDVRTTASTVFQGGSPVDLDNGVEVEAEGHISLGVLVASKIKFEREVIRMQTTVTAHTASSLTLFDKTVSVNADLTLLKNIALGSIVDNTTRVEMRGYEDSGGAIIAVRIDAAGGGNDFLQAQVTAKNTGAKTLVLMSGGNVITADLSGVSGNSFLDASHNPIGSAAFFAAVAPSSTGVPGTIVKVKGSYSAGTIAGTEAEIEK